MATPTEYDKVQDVRLDTLDRLVTPAPKTRTGPQYSFPVTGQDVSQDDFLQMMLAMPSGIADEGGRPLWLKNRSNVTNTAQITVSTTAKDAKACLGGFFWRMTQDITIDLPPVSRQTTYHVCLTFDPTRESVPEGPISLQVYAGTPPGTDRRLHLVLWKVIREPSQLLTEATVIQVRPKAAPQLTSDTPEQLPDPRSVLWGTTSVITYGNDAGAIYQADGDDPEGRPSRWDNITRPAWKNITLSSSFQAYLPCRYRIIAGEVILSGVAKLKNGSLSTTSGTPVGWISGLDMPDYRALVPINTAMIGALATKQGSKVRDVLEVHSPNGGAFVNLHNIRIPLG